MKKQKRLKTLPQYFEEIIKGNKRAELRFNDRDFKVGDIYELEEYDGKTYTGRSVTVRITHILEGFEGLAKGWCVFSFITIEEAKEENKPPKDAKYGELLGLIAENPSLPVVPMVNSEVVADDDYAYWLGSFSNSTVDEYVCVNERFYTRDNQDEIEDYFSNYLCDDYPDMPDEEFYKMIHEKVEALPWKKAIIVYIDLPE